MKIRTSKLDRMMSWYIRSRDNWTCQRCNTSYSEGSKALHNSHYFGRSAKSTRFCPDNCTCLCCGCHRHLDGNPHEHYAWKLEQLGEERYNALYQRHAQMVRYNKSFRREVEAWLRSQPAVAAWLRRAA